jgi:hypothetical protein
MTRRMVSAAGLLLTATLCIATPASAQLQPLGTFRWQLQPYCNILTFAVTQNGPAFTLDGYDDNCGAANRSPAVGIATVNPNGSVQMAVTVITAPEGASRHIDASLNLVTVSGTWRAGSLTGPLAFNAATGGSVLPVASRELDITSYGSTANIAVRRAQGTPAVPAPVLDGHALGQYTAEGFDGQFFAIGAAITVNATQNWTPQARGARMLFSTAENDQGFAAARMAILGNGFVGINTLSPSQRLHVNGPVRIGSCTYETDGDIACVSDARFKDGVRGLGSMLDRVTELRPVRFHWRTAEFADREFPARETTGLIAQDVERVLPELVTTDADGYKSVNYGRLPLLAVQSLTELKAQHDALERRNADLERRLARLEAALATLTKP